MKILLLAIGKRHDAKLAAAIDDYVARLQRYARVEWQFVPSPHATMSSDEQKERETAALMSQIKSDDYVVLLDERGQQWSTRQLAEELGEHELRGTNRVVFIIGGAYGVASELSSRADEVWALSKLILPHQLVRLVLAEQLYRAFTILRGEPYHHD
ncbi:MAG: 23S rRNA (pseudouridine(1915)-N(3))-methyltransferase RlmH [Candidatus Saccharimonadales bacterium]